MPPTTGEEVRAAFHSRLNNKPVSLDVNNGLQALLRTAKNNEGTERFPQFTRAYQASFALSPDAIGALRLQPVELSSYLRLDLGDGTPAIAPSEGLKEAILGADPKLFDELDVAAIRHAAQTSVALATKVRVNLKADGAVNRIANEVRANTDANLVGEIVVSGWKPPPTEQVVNWAQGLTDAGAGFALSNVRHGKQLETLLDALDKADLKPETADLDFGIGKHLGMPDKEGETAFDQAVAILKVAKEHDVTVSVTAIAVGTPGARKAILDAADEAGYPIDQLRMSGRDLMAETVNIVGEMLPTRTIERGTGALML